MVKNFQAILFRRLDKNDQHRYKLNRFPSHFQMQSALAVEKTDANSVPPVSVRFRLSMPPGKS